MPAQRRSAAKRCCRGPNLERLVETGGQKSTTIPAPGASFNSAHVAAQRRDAAPRRHIPHQNIFAIVPPTATKRESLFQAQHKLKESPPNVAVQRPSSSLASKSHSFRSPSKPRDASERPSLLKEQPTTASVCPASVPKQLRVSALHSLMVVSSLPDAIVRPS